MVITAATPDPAARRRNHRLAGMRRRKIQAIQYQPESRHNSEPNPTITSHDRWTVLTCEVVGSSADGLMFRPFTTVLVPVCGSERIDASPGIRMPPLTVPALLRCPKRVSGMSLDVWGTSSM